MVDSPESFQITVDVPRALEILGGNVFTGPQCCLRELVANAADSISQLPGGLKRRAEIRLRRLCSKGSEILTVSDNGVGMTKSEAARLLGTIFGTDKLGTETIGRFGIGFYSSFPLCSHIEVLTRTHQLTDKGTRVIYSGGKTLQVLVYKVPRPGTTVILRLRPECASVFNREHLTGIVRNDCNFVRYPIYLGDGWDVLNAMDAPWYHDASEDEIMDGLEELLGIENILAVFPVRQKLGVGCVHGAIFILPTHNQSGLRLYSKRILVTKSETFLLDKEFHTFFSGVIDAEDLPLVISRDAILGESQQASALKTLLAKSLGRGLAKMARKRPNDFRRLFAEHGPSIKTACLKDISLLEMVRNHFQYRSSLRASVTVPDYLSSRNDKTVIFTDDASLGSSLIPLYNQANIEVLYMTDSADRILQKNWRIDGTKVKFKRLDEDPPGTSKESDLSTCAPDVTTLEALRILFKSSVGRQVRVELRSLRPDGPPAILSLSETDREKLEFVEAVKRYKQEGRLAELPKELQQMAKDRLFLDILAKVTSQTVLLNAANPIVAELVKLIEAATRRRSGGYLEPLLARFLYGQALLSSGLHLSSDKLTEISQNQTNLITALLRSASGAIDKGE